MTVCHPQRRRPWGYKPLSIHDLLPMLGYEARDWQLDELPELVRLCGWCDGKGIYEQTYNAGCGGGLYRSMGQCDTCKGVGLRYFTGGDVPITVIVQIMNARPKVVPVLEDA